MENKERVRERDREGEVMFLMSSDVMRKVSVEFMNIFEFFTTTNPDMGKMCNFKCKMWR